MSKTPKLRFKEFSGDWETKKLGTICDITMGQSPSSSCYNEENIGLPLIQGNADVKCRKTEPRIYTSDITKTCDIGDIIMSVRAPVGAISKSIHNACIGRGVCSIKTKQSNEFIYQFLVKYEDKWSGISQGSTFESVNRTDIANTNVSIPSKEEQEKIASFFSLIDDKISLQGEKVEALKDYKKGMMQKIFSRKLRFKDDDGRDYPEWEITTMEKVADLEKGFTPDTKNEKNWIGNIPWLSIADMKQGKYLTDVSKYISDKALGNKQLVAEGTLIMSFKLTLGRLAIVNRPMITNEAICHFYWKYNNINTEYMYYYLSTVNIASFGCRAAKGITLNNDSLNSIVVKLPVINEQMKISNLLKNIDNKIEKEQEKLDSLNEYKKGLLQQMFV